MIMMLLDFEVYVVKTLKFLDNKLFQMNLEMYMIYLQVVHLSIVAAM